MKRTYRHFTKTLLAVLLLATPALAKDELAREAIVKLIEENKMLKKRIEALEKKEQVVAPKKKVAQAEQAHEVVVLVGMANIRECPRIGCYIPVVVKKGDVLRAIGETETGWTILENGNFINSRLVAKKDNQ